MYTAIKITLGILFIACSCGSCSAASCCAPGGGTPTTTDNAKTTDITLNIEGMTCQECVSKVQKSLTSVTNVTKASVSLKDKNVVVSTTDKADADALIKAVEKAGFKATKVEKKKE